MAKRILIADDSELLRQQVRRIIGQDRKLEICDEAANGQEAVRKARHSRPDLVLMDVFMPGISGLAAVQEIKRTSPYLPVVVFTLADSAEFQAESRKAGADAFVSKTTGTADLLPTIHRLLGKS